MTLAQDTFAPSLPHITREIRSTPPGLGGNGGGLRRSDLDHTPGHGPPMADEGGRRRVRHFVLVSPFFADSPSLKSGIGLYSLRFLSVALFLVPRPLTPSEP